MRTKGTLRLIRHLQRNMVNSYSFFAVSDVLRHALSVSCDGSSIRIEIPSGLKPCLKTQHLT